MTPSLGLTSSIALTPDSGVFSEVASSLMAVKEKKNPAVYGVGLITLTGTNPLCFLLINKKGFKVNVVVS